jgi:membrane-associated phospholipid phosphatase
MRLRRVRIVIPGILLGCFVQPAAASDRLAPEPARTAAIAASALGLILGAELTPGTLMPAQCRWCDPPAFDRSVRDALRWSDTSRANLLSHVAVSSVGLGLATADFAARGDLDRGAEDLLVAVEAIAIAGVATEVVKFAAARRRPYAWAAGVRREANDDTSFPSGHAAAAFAAAGAFGTIAHLRGDSAAPVYAVGFAAATGVAYLRMAADRHWLSDVATGAALGTAIGVAAPLLLHRRSASSRSSVAFSAGPGVATLAISF